MLQSLHHLHCSLHGFLPPVSPAPDPSTPDVAPPALSGGKDHLPPPTANPPADAAQGTLSLLAARAHRWLMVSLVPSRTLRAFSAKLLSSTRTALVPTVLQLFQFLRLSGTFAAHSFTAFPTFFCWKKNQFKNLVHTLSVFPQTLKL